MEPIKKAKQLIEKYYSVVSIHKTGGFSAEPGNNGNIKGKDLSYDYPEGTKEMQKDIISIQNELIKTGQMHEYKRWLASYERNLKHHQ